ncbi:hypothetical protein JXA59_00215 [Patescibacteria group bacterium]|nr:hypothetical protein [Patescibacteria group bacterium]
MPKPLHLIFFFLILGVIYAEFLPTLRPTHNSTAYSKDEPLTQNELILSWLKHNSESVTTAVVAGDQDFIGDIIIPTNLGSLARDTAGSLSYNYIAPNTTVNSGTGYASPSAVPTQDQPFVGSVIPPAGTPLFEAYAKGGYAWYDENDNVIVMMPDGTLRSFLKSDGSETNWQQDRLTYEPINSPNALENYLNNYHGKVVAETQTWAFVKFPSGGFLKIAKSTGGPFLSQQ